MDLALRFVRDVFSEDFRRLVVDDKPTYDKVVSFLKKTSPRARAPGAALQGARAAVRGVRAAADDRLGAQAHGARCRAAATSTIDKTEALTAIDVNTGKFVGKQEPRGDDPPDQPRGRRRGRAPAAAARHRRDHRHRLHRHGGLGPPSRGLLDRLSSGARARPHARRAMSEISRLGLVEMTRKNVTDGLYGVLTEPCPSCGGRGHGSSRGTTRRITVERRMREILRTGQVRRVPVRPESRDVRAGDRARPQHRRPRCAPRRASRSRSSPTRRPGRPRSAS